MSEQKLSLQDTHLNELRKERTMVAIYLVSGIRLLGEVEAFDAYAVLLKSNISQLVYKHAIATIIPARTASSVEGDAFNTAGREQRSTTNPTIVTRKRVHNLA
jgi:host factor-I protein